MKKNMCVWMLAAVLPMSSCVDDSLYRPANKVGDVSEYFDFGTTMAVQVNVDYGVMASGALLEFYTSNPLAALADGIHELVEKPVYRVFADERGTFSGCIAMPAAASEVYIYSPSWNAPMLVQATINNGCVTVIRDASCGAVTRMASRAGEGDYQVYAVPGKDGFYALYDGYDEYGNVSATINSSLLSTGELSPDFYTKLQFMLWGEKLTKPTGLNNSKYQKDASVVNTTLLSEVKDPATGEMKTVEDVELYFTLVGEAGWYENAIGYYYYKTADGEPATPSGLKKIFIMPNISIPYQAPYGVVTKNGFMIDNELAPAKINTRVQLLFVDDEGQAHATFPPGYTVGYFILPAAFGMGTEHYKSMSFAKPLIYSNNNWNAGKRKNFIALQTADGSIVYGCEDGADNSYEDVLYTISASPNHAIRKDEELPSIDIEAVKELYVDEVMERTYAFEDIWPDGGDYDLNDVIVEHRRTVTMNQKNYVASVVDVFTPVQPDGSASYTDAFAVQYAAGLRGHISLPEGAVDEKATGSVIVFGSARSGKGNSYVVERMFDHSLSNGITKTQFDNEDYNPFIISQYVAGSQSRAEVHMPKAKPTAYANPEMIGSKDDAYYINTDRLHPFAITLPLMGWTPVTECVSISVEYPNFDAWVTSNGRTNADWYLYRQAAQ